MYVSPGSCGGRGEESGAGKILFYDIMCSNLIVNEVSRTWLNK